MTCEKSRIRNLMKMWQISYVGNNRESEKERNLRGRCEKNLLRFKTGPVRIKWLHGWGKEVKELEVAR